MRLRLLALLLVAAALAAGCDTRHKDAAAAAEKELNGTPPTPTDIPFELPPGTTLDVPRMRVQRAAEVYKATIERKEPFGTSARTYFFLNEGTPEQVVEHFKAMPNVDQTLAQVVTKDGPCEPPKLGDAKDVPGVKDPRYADKGPCKASVIKMRNPDAMITIHHPVPDLISGEWRWVTGLRVMFRTK